MAAPAYTVRSPPLRTTSSILSPPLPASSSSSHPSRIRLPQGACGYRELSVGHNCGCRWFCPSNSLHSQDEETASGVGSLPGSALCFCGHHACYHEWQPEANVMRSLVVDNGPPMSQIYQTSHSVSEFMRQQPGSFAAQKLSGSFATGESMAASSSQYRHRANVELPHSLLPHPNSQNLPSTQSSFKLPSEISVRSSRQQSMFVPRPSEADIAKSRIGPPCHRSLQLVPPRVDDAAQSATEIATPSSSGIVEGQRLEQADVAFQDVTDQVGRLDNALAEQDIRSLHSGGSQVASNIEPHNKDSSASRIIQELISHIATLKGILQSIPNFRTSFTGLSQRLDALENQSMCHGSLEDVQERHEHFDGRLLDVEGRIEEFEKAVEGILARVSARSSVEGAEGEGENIEQSIESLPSPASDSAVACIDEILARLGTLDRRLSRFEASAPPSADSPWNVEVVLLPWGRHLRGLWWSSTADYSQPSTNGAISQDLPEWHHESAKEWMFPRACGPTNGTYGRIYERLKSRGFVKPINFTSSSARQIEFDIMWEFADILQVLTRGEGSTSAVDRPGQRQLRAIFSPFVPLRKIHRSSALRFLDPAELATKSLWTAEFLNSSVMMKAPTAGQRRLFITTSSAYLQQDVVDDWNWQKLRELPRCGLLPDFVDEADAMEPCWNFDDRLDPPLSAKSSSDSSSSSKSVFGGSFASPPPSPRDVYEDQSLDPSSEADGVFEQAQQAVTSGTPMEKRAPITPVSQYLIPGPPLVMTHRASIPINTTEVPPSSSSAKRPITATDQNTSSTVPTLPWKRRRLSRSPASTGDGIRDHANWAFTPRLSREPPSPGWLQQYQRHGLPSSRHGVVGFEEDVDPVLFEPAAGGGRRGVTPSAYATPHSNTLAEQGGGDTDVDGDSESESEADSEVEDVDLASRGAVQALGEEDEAWEGLIEEDEEEDEDWRDDEDNDEDDERGGEKEN